MHGRSMAAQHYITLIFFLCAIERNCTFIYGTKNEFFLEQN